MADHTSRQQWLPLPQSLQCYGCGGHGFITEHGSDANVLFRCAACAIILKLDHSVLDAVPQSLAAGTRQNQEYYNSISTEAENPLVVRSASRNHRRKTSMLSVALKLTDSETPLRVLEIGTGTGTHAHTVRQLGHYYAGLDLSSGLLHAARARYDLLEQCLFIAADATNIPLRTALFERVFCVASLHHLIDPQRGVAEMLRMLEPGGRFCILEPKRFYPTHFANFLLHRDTEVSVLQMKISRVRKWLMEAGATSVETSYCVYTPNKPAVLVPLYDAIDRFCERHRALNPLSVMFCLHGIK
ncbi:MAG: class I SAM-dependent methyltransferase [Candidatus Sumerlaeaceae bacterium]